MEVGARIPINAVRRRELLIECCWRWTRYKPSLLSRCKSILPMMLSFTITELGVNIKWQLLSIANLWADNKFTEKIGQWSMRLEDEVVRIFEPVFAIGKHVPLPAAIFSWPWYSDYKEKFPISAVIWFVAPLQCTMLVVRTKLALVWATIAARC